MTEMQSDSDKVVSTDLGRKHFQMASGPYLPLPSYRGHLHPFKGYAPAQLSAILSRTVLPHCEQGARTR
jgi:hypothetical protein